MGWIDIIYYDTRGAAGRDGERGHRSARGTVSAARSAAGAVQAVSLTRPARMAGCRPAAMFHTVQWGARDFSIEGFRHTARCYTKSVPYQFFST